MLIRDILSFSLFAATANRGRTLLSLLAMAMGVSAVVVLISLGDSARLFVIDQFSSLGSNLLIVLPGRSETTGGPPPLLGLTPRDLTLDDAQALTRIATIRRLAPIIAGSAPISVGHLEREMLVLGSSSELFAIRHLSLSQGIFLPLVIPVGPRPSASLVKREKPSFLVKSQPLAKGSASATVAFGLSGCWLPLGFLWGKMWGKLSLFRLQ